MSREILRLGDGHYLPAGGRGCWAILGGGVMKKILLQTNGVCWGGGGAGRGGGQNFIYESIGGSQI